MAPALAGLAIVALDFLPGGPLYAARHWGFDTWQRLDRPSEATSGVVIVDIDEAALAAGGRWPWSRSMLARLLQPLGGARAVGIDILLRNAEPAADESLVAAIKMLPVVLAVGAGPRALPSADGGPGAPIAITPVLERGENPSPFLPHAGVALPPLNIFASAAKGLGVSLVGSHDGVVRSLPGLVLIQGSRWPSFLVEILRVATGAREIAVDAGAAGITGIEVGSLELPTNLAGELLPRFAAAGHVPVISASRLLAGDTDPNMFKNRIVLLGVGAPGAGYFLSTPIGNAMSSIQVEAAALDGALEGRLLRRLELVAWAERLAALALSFLVVFLLDRGSYRLNGLVFLAGLIVPPAIAAWAYFGPGVLVDWVVPMAAMVATGCATLGRFALAAVDARREQAQAREAARASDEASRRELALREDADAARQSLSLALDAADLGIWDADLAAGTWRFSPHYAAVLGLGTAPSRWTIAGMTGLLADEDRPRADAALTGVDGDRFDFECRVLDADADGSGQREIRVVGRLWRGPGGAVTRVAGVVADITRERTLERRLLQAERMQAIGMLAGGVAHNFNNLLTIIVGKLDLAQRSLPNDAPAAELLGGAISAADRGSHVARHLLAFARGQEIEPRAIDVAAQVREVVSLLRDSLPETVRLDLKLDADLGRVKVDPGEFDLALLNLVVNARDAMPEGGHVRVEARRETNGVTISVADDGPGVAPGVLARVFEPFVTTKPPTVGTGLGLSQVHGFVHNAGGTVYIESLPGRGATVRIFLPSMVSTTGDAAPRVAPPAGAPRGPTTPAVILLVDDEFELMRISTEILTEEGYQVHAVGSAAEALALLRGGLKADLLFTDIIMPGEISGTMLAAMAVREYGGIRVLLTTGYSQDIEGEDSEAMPVLLKPYRAEELCQKVRSVLTPRLSMPVLS